jgi:hypothetical protein
MWCLPNGNCISHIRTWGATFGLPILAILIWGLWAAPRSRHRLSTVARVPLEVGMLALAVVALVATGQVLVGAAFAVLFIVNAVLLTTFRQWDA